MRILPLLLIFAIVSQSTISHAQTSIDTLERINIPPKFLGTLNKTTRGLDDALDKKTNRFLQKTSKREAHIYKRIRGVDSAGAAALFGGATPSYETLNQTFSKHAVEGSTMLTGEYRPYADSIQCLLQFLKAYPGVTSSPALQQTMKQWNELQTKLKTYDDLRQVVLDQKRAISQYIQQHAGLENSLGKQLHGMNEDLYNYSKQLRSCKDALNDPDKLTKATLAILEKLPAFQSLIRRNSQLAGLFNLPNGYESATNLAGLQGRDQVAALIQQQVSAAGVNGSSTLQANLQTAESQLGGYKEKLSQLGAGGTDLDMKDFKPNNQKTKPFWKRLEYGVNFQTTRNNYYFPTISDFGVSVGYRFSESTVAGIGASYKLGWGNGIQHIALSSQGCGLRSYLDIRIKGSFSASGGFEYNYTTPFSSAQQLRHWEMWSKSGLVGISKTISLKSRVFSKTKMQLLWDFLSYQQSPKTQPFLFRIGYNF